MELEYTVSWMDQSLMSDLIESANIKFNNANWQLMNMLTRNQFQQYPKILE